MSDVVSSRLRRGLLGLWLVAVWSTLWGVWRPDVVISGVLVAIAVLHVSHLPALPMRTRTGWVRLPLLVLRFAADMLRSSWHVAVTTARAGRSTRSALVGVQLQPGATDTAVVLACNRVSLEPGSIVVDIDRPRDLLYVYLLDTPDDETVEEGRRRVQRVLDDVMATFTPRRSADPARHADHGRQDS